MSQATTGLIIKHFIVRKTKKTYLSDCENATKKNKLVYFASSKLVFICHCQENLSK